MQAKSLRKTGQKNKSNHLASDAIAKAALISLDARTFEYGATMPQKARYMGNWNRHEGEKNAHENDRKQASMIKHKASQSRDDEGKYQHQIVPLNKEIQEGSIVASHIRQYITAFQEKQSALAVMDETNWPTKEMRTHTDWNASHDSTKKSHACFSYAQWRQDVRDSKTETLAIEYPQPEDREADEAARKSYRHQGEYTNAPLVNDLRDWMYRGRAIKNRETGQLEKVQCLYETDNQFLEAHSHADICSYTRQLSRSAKIQLLSAMKSRLVRDLKAEETKFKGTENSPGIDQRQSTEEK